MTKKIERVIDCCNNCRYCKEFQYVNSNCDFTLICCPEDDDGNDLGDKSFLIARGHKSLKHSEIIEIPKQCPLEDYEK